MDDKTVADKIVDDKGSNADEEDDSEEDPEQNSAQEGRQESDHEDTMAWSQPPNKRRADHFAERLRYAYLFHLWAEPRLDGTQPIWRFSLEEVEGGVRRGFGSWEALVEFLQHRMAVE